MKARSANAIRRKKGLRGAAAMRKQYGARALSVSIALKNIARTPAQRAHWAKVIRSLEGRGAVKKGAKRVRRVRKNPVKHGYTILGNGAELGTIKTRAHAVELARGFKAAHPRVKVQVRMP